MEKRSALRAGNLPPVVAQLRFQNGVAYWRLRITSPANTGKNRRFSLSKLEKFQH